MAVFTCPSCGARFRLPDDAAGRKVRCKKCQAVARIPAPAAPPPPPDVGPIPIAGESDDFAAEALAAAERARSTSSTVLIMPAESSDDLVEEARQVIAAGRQADLRTTGRTFGADVAWSLMYIAKPPNMVTFVIIWIISIASMIAQVMPGCLGVAASLILAGWIYSFLLNALVESASGEDDLPTLALTEGIVDDVFVPFFKFVATTIICFLPAAIVAVWTDELPSAFLIVMTIFFSAKPAALLATIGAEPGSALTLAIIGLCVWPMLILTVAMGGIGTVFRMDLLFSTFFRTLVPYMATAALVAGAMVVQALVTAHLNPGGMGTLTAFLSGQKLLLLFLGLGVSAYMQISAMRIIGIYYRHYKSRFAWSWE